MDNRMKDAHCEDRLQVMSKFSAKENELVDERILSWK